MSKKLSTKTNRTKPGTVTIHNTIHNVSNPGGNQYNALQIVIIHEIQRLSWGASEFHKLQLKILSSYSN